MDLSKFHVVTVISNPIRFKSRYDLYKVFQESIERQGARLWTVEMQTGARAHEITTSSNERHIQIWNTAISGEVWHKENLINIGVQHLTRQCPDWKYVAWIDADIRFEDGMLTEIVQALQHWDVVQCFSHAIDLGPNGETIGKPHLGFMYCYWNGIELPAINEYTAGSGHPGFGWACRRDAFNKMGGVIDWGILGSGDRHMACAFIGRVEDSFHGKCHPVYRRQLMQWQDRVEKRIKRNVGYIHGTIRHSWHGKKANRGYSSRWKILVNNQFNPETDIIRDASGLWQLVVESPRQRRLRDDIRKYFRARNEDSIDT